MDSLLEIGVVAKPQGIKGEIKVRVYSGSCERLNKIKKIYIDGTARNVIRLRDCGEFALMLIDGVSDRNTAESLRGKKAEVLRDDLIDMKDDEYLVCDLIGASLFSGDVLVGKITDITGLKTDVFTVRTVDGRVMRFPFLKKLNPHVDVSAKKITVDEKPLKEVSCYED